MKELALKAENATAAKDVEGALIAWRDALALLPAQTRQYQQISEKIDALSKLTDKKPETTPGFRKWSQKAGIVGVLALLLWKFKFVLVFLFTKAKFLFLGLTKAGTLFSMILSLGVYWAAWGWKFALGLVASIYIHEIGHIAKLHQYGIRASAPMFIPGLGAVVRMKQYPVSARENARVGLAGPLWGLFAALAAYAVFFLTNNSFWAAIARVGAWINLFNLLPVWQLDGGRGFRTLNRAQKWLVCIVLGAVWFYTREGLLILLLLFAALNAFATKENPQEKDWIGFWQFTFLVIILSALCLITVSGLP
ncbi:site-2 protease family protein [bacterium]|nr:site-2 protease family protein [bacterium]